MIGTIKAKQVRGGWLTLQMDASVAGTLNKIGRWTLGLAPDAYTILLVSHNVQGSTIEKATEDRIGHMGHELRFFGKFSDEARLPEGRWTTMEPQGLTRQGNGSSILALTPIE